MLVISRKLGQRVHIGPDITVTIVEVDRNKVRLGIEAPRSVQVLREELGKPEGEKKDGIDQLSNT